MCATTGFRAATRSIAAAIASLAVADPPGESMDSTSATASSSARMRRACWTTVRSPERPSPTTGTGNGPGGAAVSPSTIAPSMRSTAMYGPGRGGGSLIRDRRACRSWTMTAGGAAGRPAGVGPVPAREVRAGRKRRGPAAGAAGDAAVRTAASVRLFAASLVPGLTTLAAAQDAMETVRLLNGATALCLCSLSIDDR